MQHAIAQSVEVFTTVLAVAGMGYFVAALIAARAFLSARRAPIPAFAPGVSILKSLKGLDPGMIDAFRSHCRQSYAGEYELLFGVSSLDDPAAATVEQLRREFPAHSIRLIECPASLGSNGKVSNLVQLAAYARYDFLLINDSDITVSDRYLERVMAHFAPQASAPGRHGKPRQETGLVTALYRGRAHGTLPSHLEALGIATDFQAGVLLSRMIEGDCTTAWAPRLPSAARRSRRLEAWRRWSITWRTITSLGRGWTRPVTAWLSAPRWWKPPSQPTPGAGSSITS